MKNIIIRNKIIGAAAIAAAFLLVATPMTVFAQSNENTEKTKVVEEGIEKETLTEPEAVTGSETVTGQEIVTEPEKENTKDESYGPLTPEGNMIW
jgi:hypothetical protein